MQMKGENYKSIRCVCVFACAYPCVCVAGVDLEKKAFFVTKKAARFFLAHNKKARRREETEKRTKAVFFTDLM